MSKVKREWCAMLAKLTAPMDAATAVRAFIAMLPMLPEDDAAYNKTTLEMAATREIGDPAIPNYATINRAFGRYRRETMPVHLAMGGSVASHQITHEQPRQRTQDEVEHVQRVVASLKAELAATLPPETRQPVKANHPARWQLDALYREQGLPNPRPMDMEERL